MQWRGVMLVLVALGCGKDPGGPGGGGPVSTTYDITLRYVNTPLPHHQSAVQDAADLWERVITGDVPSLAVTPSSGSCGSGTQGQNETIDDILIWMVIEPIDGSGGILGYGGPCTIRAGSGLPAVGLMILDEADMTHTVMRRVIIHEMGHALGFGTAWVNRGLLAGEGGTEPHFTGNQARAQFDALGGVGYSNPKVPVENTGGPGTRDSHWRESVFGTELMTGFINGAADRLSAVTAGAMGDLGYTVTLGGAESYVLPLVTAELRAGAAVSLGDDLLRRPVNVVDRRGTVLRVLDPR